MKQINYCSSIQIFLHSILMEHTEVTLISFNFILTYNLYLRHFYQIASLSGLTLVAFNNNTDSLEGAAHAGVATRGGPQPFML